MTTLDQLAGELAYVFGRNKPDVESDIWQMTDLVLGNADWVRDEHGAPCYTNDSASRIRTMFTAIYSGPAE